MREKGDLSDFECGMVIGARWAGLGVSQTADSLGFSGLQTTFWVFRQAEKEKISSDQQLCGPKCLVDVRGQWRMGGLVRHNLKPSEEPKEPPVSLSYSKAGLSPLWENSNWPTSYSKSEIDFSKADLETAALNEGWRVTMLQLGNYWLQLHKQFMYFTAFWGIWTAINQLVAINHLFFKAKNT